MKIQKKLTKLIVVMGLGISTILPVYSKMSKEQLQKRFNFIRNLRKNEQIASENYEQCVNQHCSQYKKALETAPFEKISAPLREHHREYHECLMKSCKNEFNKLNKAQMNFIVATLLFATAVSAGLYGGMLTIAQGVSYGAYITQKRVAIRNIIQRHMREGVQLSPADKEFFLDFGLAVARKQSIQKLQEIIDDYKPFNASLEQIKAIAKEVYFMGFFPSDGERQRFNQQFNFETKWYEPWQLEDK